MKLALGTAQFGMHYGLTNTTGRPKQDDVEQILRKAFSAGITLLDTAQLYGESERVLGNALNDQFSFKIVTKIPPIGMGKTNQVVGDEIKLSLDNSLKQLQRDKLHAILLHDASDLLGKNGDEIYKTLALFKQDNRINKLGVSAYSPEIVEQIMQRYPIDIVQMPLNVLDQRVLKSGLLDKLKSKGIETHVRSSFLQGVLLSDVDELPARFSAVQKQLTSFQALSKNTGFSRMMLAFDFLKKTNAIEHIIIGVLSEQQLDECVFAFEKNIPDVFDYDAIESSNLDIIDPRNWQ